MRKPNRPTILKSCAFSPDRGKNALNRINTLHQISRPIQPRMFAWERVNGMLTCAAARARWALAAPAPRCV